MRRSAAVIMIAALAGCSTESASNGVNGAQGQTVNSTASVPAPTVGDAKLLAAVKIKTCEIGRWSAEVTGTITNPSREVSDLWATIEITTPAGDRIDEAGVIETAVKPGQKANFKAVGLEKPSTLSARITCTVKSAMRFKTQ